MGLDNPVHLLDFLGGKKGLREKMKLTEQISVVKGIDGDVRINRMPGGFPKIEAGTRAVMDTEEIHTNLAGGASDSRFSKYYTNGMANWKNGVYEVFKP
jgi:acyl-homoserine lactone acylase PvdQ